mmetsp:Transcript_20684/g.30397  ORF Transcript_20684/g.30397 Transcript_20684/m.30397 type:complete len:94 (-) Transcript_20684:21-302(-)
MRLRMHINTHNSRLRTSLRIHSHANPKKRTKGEEVETKTEKGEKREKIGRFCSKDHLESIECSLKAELQVKGHSYLLIQKLFVSCSTLFHVNN